MKRFCLVVAVAAAMLAPAALAAISTIKGIDPVARLGGRGHLAMVSGHLGCDVGEVVELGLTLTQDGVSAAGARRVPCTGAVEQWQLPVVVRGADALSPGPALVCADATSFARGAVSDSVRWCRDGVSLVAG